MSSHEQCPYQDGRVVIDHAFKADSPARFARSRKLGPLHPAEFHLGLKGWVVVGYDLAREALSHPHLLKDATPAAEALAAAGYILNRPSAGLGAQMMEADPPEHTRLRGLASAAFTPRRTTEMVPRVERIAHGLIDARPPSGELDLVEAFHAPLPATVITQLLSIPDRHHRDFRRWAGPRYSRWPRPGIARPWPRCTRCRPDWSRTNAAVPGTTCCPPWSPCATRRTAGSPRRNWWARP